MNRKEFMIGCGLCLLGMPGLLSSCAGTRYVSVPIEGDSLVVPVQSFISESDKGTKILKYLVVHNDQLEYPICVYRFSETEYMALLMRCTHQGTELQVFGDRLQCPAHGSEFGNTGEVKNGPADTPLRTFMVSLAGETINKIIMRAFLFIILLASSTACFAQIDSTLLRRTPVDTTARRAMNMDAVYNRPFLKIGKTPVSIGGYIEAHYQYLGTNGISEGHSFAIPRMTLFVASSMHRKIRFLSELELEEGGKEISIEFAAVDFNLHPLANFRGGVIMNPIGAFNQNHDGPKWEFINRPVGMTQMLPATWSNVGAGMYGRQYIRQWAFGYEVYLTNGFNDAIVSNNLNRTSLPASKESRERFEESSNGKLLLTAKTAVRYAKVGEIGISYMGGVYNKFQDDGLKLDDERRVDVWAIDFNTTLPVLRTYIVGEYAFVKVDVGTQYGQQFGERQGGGFVDIVQPVVRGNLFGFQQAVVNIAVRLETVDWNKGKFAETNANIGDDFRAIVPGISFRPTQQTVIRLNYRYEKQRDIFGNPPAKSGGIQVGLSSYF